MADDVRIGHVTPPKDVLDYFRGKSLRPAFSWLDVWGQEHAHAFTVAKATEVDVLAAFRATIDDAISRGLGFEDWRANLEPKLASLGWWGPRSVVDDETGQVAKVDFSSPRRLRNIFWSNMRAARAAGQWERAQATKDVLPYLLYNRTTATDPRQEHLDWVGILLLIDHPFWQTHFPPNGWGCKCSVRQVGRAEARRLGGPSADPVVETTPFVNRRTGEQVDVPIGIDPGWHTNPGHARGRGLGRVLVDKIDRIPDRGGRQAVIDDITGSDDFDRMINRPRRPRQPPAAPLATPRPTVPPALPPAAPSSPQPAAPALPPPPPPPKPPVPETSPLRPAPAAPKPPAPAVRPEPPQLPAVPKPPRLELPVIELSERPAGALTSIVLLSSDTADKQARRHPEVTAETYRRELKEIVGKGQHVRAGNIIHVMAEVTSKWWHAVLKITPAGDAVYLTSLYRVGTKRLRVVWRRIQAEVDENGGEKK